MTKVGDGKKDKLEYYGEDYVWCCLCKRLIPKTDAEEHGIEYYCTKCHDLLFARCDNCGDEVDKRNSIQVEKNKYQCYECFSEEFTYCTRCRKLITKKAAKEYCRDNYCEKCYDIVTLKFIMDYSDKPEPIFHLVSDEEIVKTNRLWEGQNQLRFIGVELEVDTKRDLKDYDVESIAQNICLLFGGETDMYAKFDGTLSTRGFELVSHPMTLEAHMFYNWQGILAALRHMGFISHDAGVCGLHTHTNRTCYGKDDEIQKRNISKVLKLYAKFPEEIQQFSRRNEEQLEYCEHIELPEKSETIYEHNDERSRRIAVNLQNDDTIEYRIFNGTLNYQTFIATLQFVDLMIRIANKTSQKEIDTMTWEELTGKMTGNYKELDAYLLRRGLIPNYVKTVAATPKKKGGSSISARGRRR